MNKVYKYRANIHYEARAKDSVLLANNIIYAAPIKSLNDPFESSVELPKSERQDRKSVV